MADLPPGFVLDSNPHGGIPPLPPGFEHDDQPGFLSQIGRQLGLTGRDVIEGAGNLLGTVSDPFVATANYFNPPEQSLSSLVTGQKNTTPKYSTLGQEASGLADMLGLPKPQGDLEKTVNAAAKGLVSTGLTAGGGAAAGASELAAQPMMQAISSMLGPAASQSAQNAGAGEGAQAFAGAAASLLPGAGAGMAGVTRGLARGGATADDIARNIESFAAAGTTPSVGQATQGGLARGIESLLAKVPGSAGVMARKAKEQAQQIGAKMGGLADELAPGSDPTTAGSAIQRGIAGEGGFVDRFKQQAGQLYDEVDKHMPPDTAVPVSATQQFLAKASTPTPGAEATSQVLANPKVAQIAQAVAADTAKDGSLPYGAVKALRSRVGDMLADSGLTSDVPRAQLKQLYGALSTDMRQATSQSPQAFAANNRAENFYRQGMDQIDKVESVVNRAGGPERIFQAATSGTREGATTLHAVVSALKPDEANMVSSAVLRRMGRANPSAQNDVGDAFSTETFLSNWSGMSPQAKQVLFDRVSPSFKSDMDKIANVASNLREGSQVYRNPSGTATGLAQIGTASALGSSILTGHPAAAVPVLAALGTTNLSARLMTNPRFVKWLARNTAAPVGVLPAQISYLSQLGKNDSDLSEAADMLGQTFQSQ